MTKQQLEKRANEIIAECNLNGYNLEPLLRRSMIDLATAYAASQTDPAEAPKPVSARVFRLTFGTIKEPVTVIVRRPGGRLVPQGTWIPTGNK